MAAHAGAPVQARAEKSIAFNIVLILTLVACVGLGAARLYDGARVVPRDAGNGADRQPVSFTLAGTKFAVPENWLNRDMAEAGGFADIVEFKVPLRLGDVVSAEAVSVTLLPMGRALPSARLLDTLYIHEFAEGTVPGPKGLVGRSLRAEDGNQNETVWYDPLSPNPFVAKCLRMTTSRGVTGQCTRTVAMGPNVSATIRFEEDLLGAWQAFDRETLAALSGLVVRGTERF